MIQKLRLSRGTFEFRYLSIGAAIGIASLPVQLEQAGITALLDEIVSEMPAGLTAGALTVQERTALVVHYMSSTCGTPDFPIDGGDGNSQLKISDYLVYSQDYPCDSVSAGELGGDQWRVRQLTGDMAEAIERMDGVSRSGYMHWMFGCMAAQMYTESDTSIPDDIDPWLMTRIKMLESLSEADFFRLQVMWLQGREQLMHLFRLALHCKGSLVVLGGAGNMPARFLADSIVSSSTKKLVSVDA